MAACRNTRDTFRHLCDNPSLRDVNPFRRILAMPRAPFSALALVVLWAGPVRAGTITIEPAEPVITLGQSDTFTVSMDSNNQPDGELTAIRTRLLVSGPGDFSVSNLRLDPSLPPGTSFLSTGLTAKFATILFAAGNGQAFLAGPVYEFDFTPSAPGQYDISPDPTDNFVKYVDGTDSLTTLLDTGVIQVLPAAVPEPTALTLAGLAVGGLVVRMWHRRRATT
jgi:hypothetical protein